MTDTQPTCCLLPCAAPNLPAPTSETDTPSHPGASPLCMAAGACSPGCVSQLLAAGADVHARARGGATALHVVAAMGGQDEAKACEVVQLLVKVGYHTYQLVMIRVCDHPQVCRSC